MTTELTDQERDVAMAWECAEPPSGFAGRVVQLHNAASPVVRASRRWRLWLAVGVAASLLAGAAVILLWAEPVAVSGGAVLASDRQSVTLGTRAVGVLEPGAHVQWHAGEAGTVVTQRAGQVFYRVETGSHFVVTTDVGDIRVTGTCFTVEKIMRKKELGIGGIIGAGVTAAVLVTVYEGGVVVAGSGGKSAQVAAGQTATLRPNEGPIVAPTADNGPLIITEPPSEVRAAAQNETREQLLARTEQQATRIAQLAARVAQLEQGGGPPGDPGEAAFVDIGPQELEAMAKRCEIRIDTPDVDGAAPPNLEGLAARAGLSADEQALANAAMSKLHSDWLAEVRRLYIETTGDDTGAADLSARAMASEIEDKADPKEEVALRTRLARERAGLEKAPATLAGTSALERYMRGFVALGDRAEAALADGIGPQKAKALRGSGWGARSRMAGCPQGQSQQ